MIPKSRRPIQVMHASEVSFDELKGVLTAICEVVNVAGGSFPRTKVCNLGAWRAPEWTLRARGKLIPHASVDWYLRQGEEHGREGALNASCMAELLANDLGGAGEQPYRVLVLNKETYVQGYSFIVTHSLAGASAVISTHRLSEISDPDLRHECIRTITMHEVGHMLGIPNHERESGTVVENSHCNCAGTCVMRQGIVIPEDLVVITRDRMENGPFCADCTEELCQLFQ